MIDIIRHKQVSLNDLQEGEYVINEFGGKIKGVLKLNGKLHNTIFNEESNKAPLKSEQNHIVINDGINKQIIPKIILINSTIVYITSLIVIKSSNLIIV